MADNFCPFRLVVIERRPPVGFFCAVKTVLGKASDGFDSAFKVIFVRVRSGYDEVNVLVRDFGVSRNCAVDKGFQLGVYRIKIDGACENDCVRIDCFVKKLSHVVLPHAFVRGVTDSAAFAVTDVFVRKKHLFGFISGGFGAFYEPVAEYVGVAVLSRACRNNQNIFHDIHPYINILAETPKNRGIRLVCYL